MSAQRKSHQTTIRFSDEQWRALVAAAHALEISVAQYVREAARGRLEGTPSPESQIGPADPRPALHGEMRTAMSVARERVLDSSALWEQGHQARLRAIELREESARQRRRHGRDESSFDAAAPKKGAHVGG